MKNRPNYLLIWITLVKINCTQVTPLIHDNSHKYLKEFAFKKEKSSVSLKSKSLCIAGS